MRVNGVLPSNIGPLASTVASVLGALLSPIAGAVADFSAYRRGMFGYCAFSGGVVMALPIFVTADNGLWRLAVACYAYVSLTYGLSLTFICKF